LRHVATLLLWVALGIPGLASAEGGRGSGECRHLTNQIDFFEDRLETAEQLGNELWEARLAGHVDGLRERRATRCPEYSDSAEAMRQLEQMLALAAKGAATFFTMGMF
jgi:hypothetical protein